jgi:hypothetical protein
MGLTCNRKGSEDRRRALEAYLTTNVLGSDFVCQHYAECRGSHSQTFYEGQLHHIGRSYDLRSDGAPVRVVVVGQEYGHSPARVKGDCRHKMVMSSGLDKRFRAEEGYKGRNPHMRGTTSALRLLFGIPLGVDHPSEFLALDEGEPCHLFDAFALVNYLLCSAVPFDGTKRGRATQVMKRNCREHFRQALLILEPTVVVVQGVKFWRSCVQDAFDGPPERVGSELPVYTARIGPLVTLVVAFTHPSAWHPYHWGAIDPTPYLTQTVEPSLESARERVLGHR